MSDRVQTFAVSSVTHGDGSSCYFTPALRGNNRCL